ncbi:MAG: hypothetical protein J6R38_00565, partial [Alistipes sp.]|nr:hypothetical protein [Alistipes sp.]
MKKLMLFAFAVFAFVACTQNDVEELTANRADVPETLTVGFEGGDDTRIQLNEAQKTVWTKGDIVSVFYRSNANQKWQYQGETGERVGVLKRLESGVATRDLDNVVVVYPYNENYYINPNSCSVQAMLPATQHYKQNSYGYDGNIMVSCEEYNQISLRNVCGWLKIQLTGNGEKVQSITLRGNNGEQVAGEVYINAYNATSVLASDMGSLPEDDEIGAGGAGGGLQFDDTIFTELTLDCGEGVELCAEAKSFYIAVPPQTFEQGVTVVVECEGYEPMTLTTTSVLTIERNHIKPMESVEHDSVEIPSVLKVVTRMYDGFAVHVDIPEDVKTRGNALRYSTSSLAVYNYLKSLGYMELDMLLYNAQQYITEDKTIIYDEVHSTERDENGDLIYDEEGNLVSASYADPKVPGEPGVFMVGEFGYMDNPDENIVYENGEITTVYEDMYTGNGTVIWAFPVGWSNGYYRPEYDWLNWINELETDAYDTEKYWSGYYELIQIDTLEPGLCDGAIEIDVYSMSPKDATIYLTPIDNPTSYSFFIIEEEDFQNEVMPLLDYNYDYLRWFTGSYFALHTLGVKKATGSVAMKLTDWFVDTKGFAGKTFRILVTIMGDAEGKTQNFRTKTFTLPAATKPAPEVIVTALENDDPYLATFNIKAPNKDVYEAYFACNYVREFDNILDSYTYLSLLQDMGNKFGNTEIE